MSNQVNNHSSPFSKSNIQDYSDHNVESKLNSHNRIPSKSFSQSQISQKSPNRSFQALDSYDKVEQAALAKEEYENQLESFRNQEGVTEEDIRDYQKGAIIQKSVDLVKARSTQQAQARKSPNKYSAVKSKVTRSIQVQNKTSRQQLRGKRQSVVEPSNSQIMTEYSAKNVQESSFSHEKKQGTNGTDRVKSAVNLQNGRQPILAQKKAEQLSPECAQKDGNSNKKDYQKYINASSSSPDPLTKISISHRSPPQKQFLENTNLDNNTHNQKSISIFNLSSKMSIEKGFNELGEKMGIIEILEKRAQTSVINKDDEVVISMFEEKANGSNAKQNGKTVNGSQSKINQNNSSSKKSKVAVKGKQKGQQAGFNAVVNQHQDKSASSFQVKAKVQGSQAGFNAAVKQNDSSQQFQVKAKVQGQNAGFNAVVKQPETIQMKNNKVPKAQGGFNAVVKQPQQQPKNDQPSLMTLDQSNTRAHFEQQQEAAAQVQTFQVKSKAQVQNAGFNAVVKVDNNAEPQTFQMKNNKVPKAQGGFNAVTKQSESKPNDGQPSLMSIDESNTRAHFEQQQQIAAQAQTFQVKQKQTSSQAGFNQAVRQSKQQDKNQEFQVNKTSNLIVQSENNQILPTTHPTLLQDFELAQSCIPRHQKDSANMSSSSDVDKIKSYPQQNESCNLLNKDLEQKTNAIQDEFNQLLTEMMNNREKKQGTDDFYQVMQEVYGKTADDQKHESPTKRLIHLKNSTFDHKQVMKDNIQRQDYSLTYCSSPGKSYIIEPHGGELNYKIADKNPLKFYDQVFNQDITQHKVKEEQSPTKRRSFSKPSITSKVTKRKHLKVMNKIRVKIAEKLREKFGIDFGQNVLIALQDQRVDHSIKILMKQDKIQLVNEKNQPIYAKQISEAAAIFDSSKEADESYSNDYEDQEEDSMSPDVRDSKTKISMKDQDLKKIEIEVREVMMKQNSKKEDNQY